MKKVVIVGGGVGGTIIANAVSSAVSSTDAEITLISDNTKHIYQPSFMAVALGHVKPDALFHSEQNLLSDKVKFVNEKARRVDTKNKKVESETGKQFDYDFLVIAAGARYTPAEIPGFEEAAHHFYDIQHALKLREALSNFTGGKILIGVGSVPYKCPPAPLEFAFLVEEYFKKKGMRNVVDIQYFYPINGVFTITAVEPMLAKLLEERNIPYHVFFNPEAIDLEKKTVRSVEGDTLEYD
ncbi:MAG: FAD/NAD(P)-binding oxidoreductase, partial [Nitrososphaerales archaeon]